MKTYSIYTTKEDELNMLEVVKARGLHGLVWVNADIPRFDLEMDEEDLLLLKLLVPFTLYDPTMVSG